MKSSLHIGIGFQMLTHNIIQNKISMQLKKEKTL